MITNIQSTNALMLFLSNLNKQQYDVGNLSTISKDSTNASTNNNNNNNNNLTNLETETDQLLNSNNDSNTTSANNVNNHENEEENELFLTKPTWVNAKSCEFCNKHFSTLTMIRPHHCRICARTVCDTCSKGKNND